MKKTIFYFSICITILFSGCASTNAFKYAKSGNLPKLKELVENDKISLNLTTGHSQNTLFDEAVKNKKFDVADYLLTKGIKINEVSLRSESCRATIHKAAWRWSFESLEYLIKNGADVNLSLCFSKITPLMYAVHDYKSKHTTLQIKKAKYLLDNGADINAKSNHPIFPDMKTSAYSLRMKEFIENYKK